MLVGMLCVVLDMHYTSDRLIYFLLYLPTQSSAFCEHVREKIDLLSGCEEVF